MPFVPRSGVECLTRLELNMPQKNQTISIKTLQPHDSAGDVCSVVTIWKVGLAT